MTIAKRAAAAKFDDTREAPKKETKREKKGSQVVREAQPRMTD